MPLYEYQCPGAEGDSETAHVFEKIVPVAEFDKPQLCPTHGLECQPKEFSNSSWVWGKEDVHWSAGISSNRMGMAGVKRPS